MKFISNTIISVLFFVFILSQFISHSIVTYGIALLTALIMIISLFYSKGLPKYFGIVMTVISVAILIYQKQGVDVWNEGITKNLALVLLIIIVPILGIPNGSWGQSYLPIYITEIVWDNEPVPVSSSSINRIFNSHKARRAYLWLRGSFLKTNHLSF